MRPWGDDEERLNIRHRIEQGIFAALVAASVLIALASLFRSA